MAGWVQTVVWFITWGVEKTNSTFILTKIFEKIQPISTYIFNEAMKLCIYPGIIKHARVAPIFKSGINLPQTTTDQFIHF